MEYVTLNTGIKMPILGFGVYQIPPEETEQAVSAAIAVGFHHIDTAQYYRNEVGVGRAIKGSGLPREDFLSRPRSVPPVIGRPSARLNERLRTCRQM